MWMKYIKYKNVESYNMCQIDVKCAMDKQDKTWAEFSALDEVVLSYAMQLHS